MDHLDTVLAEFGGLIGLESLAFEDEECRITIDGTVVDIVADRRRGWMVLSSFVGSLPDRQNAETLSRLLDANCRPDLAGAALGVPGGGDAVVLTDQIHARGLDAQGLVSRIEPFLSAHRVGRTLLQTAPQEASRAAPPPEEAYNMMRV